MASAETRLQKLEQRLHVRGFEHIRDISEASSEDLVIYLLDVLPETYDKARAQPCEWAAAFKDVQIALTDPLERAIAFLFCKAMTWNLAHLLERFRASYPDRLFQAAQRSIQGMKNVDSRIDRIEQLFGDASCVCNEEAHRLAFVVIEPGWSEKQIHEHEESTHFTCPAHGLRRPPVVRLMPGDLSL